MALSARAPEKKSELLLINHHYFLQSFCEDLSAQDWKSDEGKIPHPRICVSTLDAQHCVQIILNYLSMGAGKPS